MGVQLTRKALDIGIVVRDGRRAVAFYQGLLGLAHEGDMPMPVGAGGTMHRLRCGDSLIKLVKFDAVPEESAPRGGIADGTGIRYLTIHVANLDEVVASCRAARVKVVVPVTEVRPGVRIAIVTDPDGNLVELVQTEQG
jgi:catechol 2,3-dioxygenase-like lactoylglutathione lyase family enzyme